MSTSDKSSVSPRRDSPGSGPVVWAAIIAATCLLLVLFQRVLWLVVPFLLALILYYFLYPPVKALIYRGMSREAAASLVTVLFLGLVTVAGVSLMPRVAGQLADWQDTLSRYLQGGLQLLDNSLRRAESHWTTLAHAHVADTYWYLSACPELMGLAVGRLERRWGELP